MFPALVGLAPAPPEAAADVPAAAAGLGLACFIAASERLPLPFPPSWVVALTLAFSVAAGLVAASARLPLRFPLSLVALTLAFSVAAELVASSCAAALPLCFP